MDIVLTDITKIAPYDKNAKAHPKKQVAQIAASIEAFGFNQPVVVDRKGIIIVGHGRYYAAISLGHTEVPVLTVSLTEEQAKAYRLADNKLNESDWDMALVVEELKGLDETLLDLTGFDRDLVLEAADEDDLIPELPAKPRTEYGDVYQLGAHRVVCGDSTFLDAYEILMGGGTR